MKGLSIEQKAKAYDKALGKAEDALNDGTISNNTIAYLQDIFPELKESEDEKIRKTLIRFHKSTIDVDGIKGEDIIAWLENLNLIKANSPQLGEQKTTDKVESKFKVGDWVIDRQDIVHQIANVIENVTNHTYGYDIVGGGYFNDNVEGVRLWTIQDARDGDVLACCDNKPFIFKGFFGINFPNCLEAYCGITLENQFRHCNSKTFWTNQDVKPATKKQRDTLEKAMIDAGYAFDLEKKELKKLGQPEVTKTSDQEEIAEIPFGAKDSELQEGTYYIPDGFHAGIDNDRVVIKKGEKPTAWSEEDEEYLRRAINATKDTYPMTAKWLKSLKQRIGG